MKGNQLAQSSAIKKAAQSNEFQVDISLELLWKMEAIR